MLIKEFYKGQKIFITGGSGFIGKALIEKLLRSCPGVGDIYVLIRPKKGKTIDERLQAMLECPLYNRLRSEQPDVLKKVHAIAGDCAELGLGISADDLAKLQDINIVFHAAASVRFDDSLRDAILLNTRGTYELVKIAETMRQLNVFVHVSTTYCNPKHYVVEEKVYPPIADCDWRTTIKLAEAYSSETLNILSMKYSDNQPNTYTFTKSLAEQIINEYRNKLPVIIFRPSIVISSIIEPVPGWVDNFNGPVGMLVACGIGIMRTNYADPNIISDFIPVDIVVRALILATHSKGKDMIQGKKEIQDQVQVFNCATASICPITTGEVIEIGKRTIRENPFEKTLWYPGGNITRCYVWNLIRFITQQVIMALLVDLVLMCANQKPFLLRLQRRIYAANLALHLFLSTSWHFENDKMIALDDMVHESEFDTFAFMQYANVDYDSFFAQGIRGAKQYLLHEPPDASSGAHFRMRILKIVHYLTQIIGVFLIVRFAYIKLFT